MGEEQPITELVTTRDAGNALEKNVEFIFQSAGFETQRNVRVAKYEIDVLAKIGDRNVVIECKNFQNGTLIIRNLIHQWNSKNQLIKASKVIIVIAGISIKQSDRELADKFNIELWSDTDLTDLFNLALHPAQLKARLMEKISFEPVAISELYRDEIAGLVIRPLLGAATIDDEEVFGLFNNWLRAFIRTELQINGTSKDERIAHIELFEGTKEKRGFFKLLKLKRKEKEYWEKLQERIQREDILGKSTQKRYYGFMQDLSREYNSQIEYYEEEDNELQVRKLITDRLYNALTGTDSECNFGFKRNNTVAVIPTGEGKFVIIVENLAEAHADLINWLLTSEYTLVKNTTTSYSWLCFSLEEAAEKVYRILDEFYGYKDSDELKDFNL